jgi:Mlc titration factor MtfA (ptsG expression regulator)
LKTDEGAERWFSPAAGALAWVATTGLGALVSGPSGAIAGGVAGLAAGASLHVALTRRLRRRRQLLATPFPAPWREILEQWCDHYQRLGPDLRRRFEDDVRIFLHEKRITGIEAEVTDELRLLVAASAVTLSLGWPDYDWDSLSEVLLYPQDFDRDYSFEGKELSGQAHGWGTVILSIPSLRHSFEDPDDAYHVGYHEFAHLLDLEQTHFDGIPAGMDDTTAREWVRLMETEMGRLRRGKSVIDDYGAEEPAEFLAVAVEAFFESALALRERHREVYTLLRDFFGQDPAAWDDARGLRP